MTTPEPEKSSLRPTKELASKIEELENTIKLLLEAFKRLEAHYGSDFMEEGEYYGIRFE